MKLELDIALERKYKFKETREFFTNALYIAKYRTALAPYLLFFIYIYIYNFPIHNYHYSLFFVISGLMFTAEKPQAGW